MDYTSMTYEQYTQWYEEYKQNELLEKDFPTINESEDIKFTYCSSCEKNCVIQVGGFTKCMYCKDILVTDLKQIRRTYANKTRHNKITHFSNALNVYLQDSKFYEVQQIVDIFTELVDFMRLTKKQKKNLQISM